MSKIENDIIVKVETTQKDGVALGYQTSVSSSSNTLYGTGKTMSAALMELAGEINCHGVILNGQLYT